MIIIIIIITIIIIIIMSKGGIGNVGGVKSIIDVTYR